MTPHLRGQVRAYVDRALPQPLLRVFDQHLVACEVCRAAAEQERRIVAALRAETGVPPSLRLTLLGVAVATAGREVPAVPEAPARVRLHLRASPFRDADLIARRPVPTIAPNTPALHRSPVRAAVVASLAATASVAAAWGLAVVPIQTGTRSPAPAAQVPADVASFGPSSFSQAVAAATGTFGAAAPLGLAASRRTSEEFLQKVRSVPSPAWTATSLGQSDVFTPVRVSVVSSAESRP